MPSDTIDHLALLHEAAEEYAATVKARRQSPDISHLLEVELDKTLLKMCPDETQRTLLKEELKVVQDKFVVAIREHHIKCRYVTKVLHQEFASMDPQHPSPAWEWDDVAAVAVKALGAYDRQEKHLTQVGEEVGSLTKPV